MILFLKCIYTYETYCHGVAVLSAFSVCFAQFEFEKINKHDVVSNFITQNRFTFRDKNIVNTPIKMLSVDITCGCAIMNKNKSLILPKEDCHIKAALKLSKYTNQAKNVIVNTDHLPQKSITLSLNINKVTPLENSPRLLSRKKESAPIGKTVIPKISYDDTLIKVTKRDENSESNEVL